MITTKPEFKVSYAGEVEYRVDGKLYRVRYFANPRMGYNDGVYDNDIQSSVGTVRNSWRDGCEYMHQFPPREVVALFPGFVGARYTEDFQTEYDGPRPVLCKHHCVPEYVSFVGNPDAETDKHIYGETA